MKYLYKVSAFDPQKGDGFEEYHDTAQEALDCARYMRDQLNREYDSIEEVCIDRRPCDSFPEDPAEFWANSWEEIEAYKTFLTKRGKEPSPW